VNPEQGGFEQALIALEERVRRLESGDLPLDEALLLYEQGVELARDCHEQLEAAEKRVAALARGRDGVEERPLPDRG
jgi:exodeoxyribonuclease VII small subunit